MSQSSTEHVIDTGGSGLPLVLLHSACGSKEHWQAQIDAFRDGHRVIALDLPGQGGREVPGRVSFDGMADDVTATLDRLGVDRFAVAGHSAGSGVAICLAASRPGRVAGLVLVDPIRDGSAIPADERERVIAALRSDGYAQTIGEQYEQQLGNAAPSTRERVMADLAATPQATTVGIFEQLATFAANDTLRRYPGPKLSIIQPASDVPEALHHAVDGVPVEVMEGVSHWLHMDKPGEFNERLSRFLNGLA